MWIVEVCLGDLNSKKEYPTCILHTQHDCLLIIKAVNGGIKTLLLGVTSWLVASGYDICTLNTLNNII